MLHFDRDELPPVNAFRSVTLDHHDGFRTPDPLNRYAVDDRDALHANADGRLDLRIQHEKRGREDEATGCRRHAGRWPCSCAVTN